MPRIIDPVAYFLDHPNDREFYKLNSEIEYVTPSFSKEIYEDSRGRSFHSINDAYLDWLDFGKRNGLPYAVGRDTLFKIILKAKDEPDLIERWIEHHARIVGYHNIVVMDCGSTDFCYIDVLDKYRDKITIFSYPHYYDSIHSIETNKEIYNIIASSCKYIAILDADEFLVSISGGALSVDKIKEVLRRGVANIFSATWIPNISPPACRDHSIDWECPIKFGFDQDFIKWGTIAGKAIARTNTLYGLKHLGHVLHVQEVMSQLSKESFGGFVLLHVTDLPPHVIRERSLKHLRARNDLPPKLVTEHDVDAYLAQLISAEGASPMSKLYAERALLRRQDGIKTNFSFSTNVLWTGKDEPVAELSAEMNRFPFMKLLSDRKTDVRE